MSLFCTVPEIEMQTGFVFTFGGITLLGLLFLFVVVLLKKIIDALERGRKADTICYSCFIIALGYMAYHFVSGAN